MSDLMTNRVPSSQPVMKVCALTFCLSLLPLISQAADVYAPPGNAPPSGYGLPPANTPPPATAGATSGVQYLSPPQLAELVAPIALYPDDLVGVVLPASTFPLQIVEAARYLAAVKTNSSLRPDDAWDNSVVALLNYPDVINMMDHDLGWTERLGQAVVNQQTDVVAAVRDFRSRAQRAGNLRSDERQVVENTQEGAIQIRPANPQVIYVPYYEPTQVIVYQSVPALHYYPQPCPVYYYPYPQGNPAGFSNFWGVSSAFTIAWGSGALFVHDYDYYDDPYFDRPYAGHFYRRAYGYGDDDGRDRDGRDWHEREHNYGDQHGQRDHAWHPRRGGNQAVGASQSGSRNPQIIGGRPAGNRGPAGDVQDGNGRDAGKPGQTPHPVGGNPRDPHSGRGADGVAAGGTLGQTPSAAGGQNAGGTQMLPFGGTPPRTDDVAAQRRFVAPLPGPNGAVNPMQSPGPQSGFAPARGAEQPETQRMTTPRTLSGAAPMRDGAVVAPFSGMVPDIKGAGGPRPSGSGPSFSPTRETPFQVPANGFVPGMNPTVDRGAPVHPPMPQMPAARDSGNLAPRSGGAPDLRRNDANTRAADIMQRAVAPTAGRDNSATTSRRAVRSSDDNNDNGTNRPPGQR